MKACNYIMILVAFGASICTQGAEALVQDIHIGLASNFSEPSSSSSNPYGDYFRDGVRLALKDSKAKLEKKHLKITLDEFDYGTNQIRVLDAAKRAAASQVIGVIGYNFSSHALLAAPIHQQAGLPMLTPSATADRVGKLGAYIHPACFDNSFMGRALAKVARNRLKAKKAVVIVAADCAYCQDLSEAFQREFIQLGGEITAKVPVLEADKDFSKPIESLKQTKFDVVLVPNQELSSARIISAALKAGMNKPFLGGDGWGNVGQEFFSILAGQNLKGYSVSHWHPEVKTTRSKKFVRDYAAEFGRKPNDTSVLAYDTTLLMVEAVVQAKNYTREGLELALNQMKTFDGVTGRAIFQKGAAPAKSLVLLSANNSQFRVIETLPPSRKSVETPK